MKSESNPNNKLPLVSIIIVDYKKNNPYLVECLEAIQKQSYKNFEIILVCDYQVKINYPKLRQKSFGRYVGPAEKRDIGARMAKGEILAFIDDDAFPSRDWLKYLVPHFEKAEIAGVGGPGLTPIRVSWQEQASGWASASPIGAGPYLYRFLPFPERHVDDFPSMNLAVRKTDFEKVGGFDSNFWPGEDTKLCLDLTHKLGQKIIYDPKVLVYHHRRPLLWPHLRQSGNFGLHRGFFAKILPQTSLQLVYFGPSLLVLGLSYLIFFSHLLPPTFSLFHQLGWFVFKGYLLALLANSLWIAIVSKNILQSLISIPVIFITHLWYGTRFLQGFLFTDKLVR